jgi:hypothetical protein
VEQNHEEAVRWFRRAAALGDAYAMFNLGLAYADDRGVAQDLAESERWYRRAAELGHDGAQLNLGFRSGTGGRST